MNPSLCLYTVCHKPFFIPPHRYIQTVWVGNNKPTIPAGDLSDDGADNISHLNEFFCELTVLYWVWKNVSKEPGELWGLCHYRRYFTDKSRPFSFSHFPINRQASQKQILHYVHPSLDKTIIQKLGSADVLLTYPVNVSLRRKVSISIYDQYVGEHGKEEWDLLQDVITEKYPDYLPSFIDLSKQTKICIANMMVARASLWNDYLHWLFHILFELHSRMKYTDDVYQRRAIGFIAERLMNLYVQHNNLKPAYMQLVVFDK
jgi:hypothetical protein